MASVTASSPWRTPMPCRRPRRTPHCTSWIAGTTTAHCNGIWYSVSWPRTAYVGSQSRRRSMKKSSFVSLGLPAACAALLLAGCGLAEVGATAAADGASAAEQAKQAKEMEARAQQKIDEAQQAAADARAKMEEAAQ